MISYTLRDTVKDLYIAFSNQPYVPDASWTTTKKFALNPLYQQVDKRYEANTLFEQQQSEFVLDTSLVPLPGIEPGSSDFQSAA